MQFLRQTWALTKKDLLVIAWRRWLSTAIRALILPIVFTVIITEVKNWTALPGNDGVGTASPILSLSDALATAGTVRNRVVLIDSGFKNGDVADVVKNLSNVITGAGRDLQVVSGSDALDTLCPSSNAGVSNCYGAVQFYSSPDHGGSWNYTMYSDASLGTNINVYSNDNDIQVYIFPFQQAIDNAIASTHGGSGFHQQVLQIPYTTQTEAQREKRTREEYQGLVLTFLAFAYFVALSGISYHLVGFVCTQRERGFLQLIDAMMPNSRRWECIAARILSTHLAFDIVYFPGWLIMGAIIPGIVFPHTQVDYLIALYIVGGLAMTSYSILASSIFKRAQISGSCAIIAALVFAIAAQLGFVAAQNATPGVYALGVLFPPSTYVFILCQIAGYELSDLGLNPNVSAPQVENWDIPASTFFGFFIFQIILYPILAGLIEKYLHGTSSRSRIVHRGSTDSGPAVKLENFSKHFKSLKNKKETVKAVDDLTVDIHAGSITVLLGANGSGKSTTLNCVAGTEKITSGTIEIDGTGGLGICPQKNIMFDLMTVKEHVEFFEDLKNPSKRSKFDRTAEIDRIVAGCDLKVKENALAKTLSGGQKRKLQLAMMLAGGSRVCCIDEASSGIDPIARRKIWDILLAERGRRTLLFTTHFLDEAEGLADHVAILSKGKLKAQGSVASLKRDMGGGYQVVFQNMSDTEGILIPENVKSRTDYNYTVLSMPDSETLVKFVKTLEQHKVHGYRIEGPTMEKVFLELAEEMKGDSDLARELRLSESDDEENKTINETDQAPARRPLNLVAGRGLTPIQQTAVIVYKRLIILRHDFWPYIAALFFSLVVAGLVTRFFLDPSLRKYSETGLPCSDPDSVEEFAPYAVTLEDFDFEESGFIWGPPSRLSPSKFQALLPYNYYSADSYYGTTNISNATSVDSLQHFYGTINANVSNFTQGGFYDDPTTPVVAWVGSIYGLNYQSAFTQAILNDVLLNQNITRAYSTFKEAYVPFGGDTSLVMIFMALGFSVYPGFFALYPTAERQRGVRAMHYSNGILSSALWAGHSIFDLVFVVLISVLSIAIWISQWGGWYAPGYMFVCFFLYGLAGTAFSYVVSLFAPTQLAAFALTSVIQVIIAMLYYVGYAIAAANAPVDMTHTWFNYIHYTVALISPAANLERALMMTLNQYSLVCRGSQKASYPGEIGIYGAPILYLTIQFILLVAFLMYWESGRSFEVFGIRRKRPSVKQAKKDVEKNTANRAQNPDATEEPLRLAEGNVGLRVSDISKSFGPNLAVDGVTFGIMPSEKFALLGPNGAGKSTMISLIQRELRPDHRSDDSAIHIGGEDLHSAPLAAKNHLGVCPQFDAVDRMTLVEHLRFYARARGVPDREANIDELIRRLGLQEHRRKMAKKLSGGTRRKLSLAIALIANPDVLLLDEPSSGMDPAAKRALWSTLSAMAAGRVLLITTHSMEEADALCDRAGIMASRLLALGGIGDLRDRHGSAAFVHLVHRDAPYTNDEDTAKIRDWVRATFPSAVIEARNFGGQMRFSIPKGAAAATTTTATTTTTTTTTVNTTSAKGAATTTAKDASTTEATTESTTGSTTAWDTGALFGVIEGARAQLGIADYSIGPATLDQVFLNVVGKHNVEEENSQRARPRNRGMLSAMFR